MSEINTHKKENIRFKIILTYAIAIAIAGLIFYFIIPSLLNYGPDTINTNFDKTVSGGLYYYQQVLLVVSSLIAIVSLILFISLKDLDNYKIYKHKAQTDKSYEKTLLSIKKLCLSLPNTILNIFIIVPLICAFIVLFMQTSFLTSSDFKLVLVIFILSTLTISITNIYIRKILSKILIDLENISTCKIKETSIKKRLLLQIIPIMSVCVVFTYLAISSIYERNNANLLSNHYKVQFTAQINSLKISNSNDLIQALKNINLYSNDHILFITDSNINFIYQTGEVSEFFKKYAKELSLKNDNIIYDYYGTAAQGLLFPIHTDDGLYYVGVHYTIYSQETVIFIVTILIILTFICFLILYASANELSKNVETVVDSLEKISNDSHFTRKVLYVTSTDEIAKLIMSYNKIQSLTSKHLEQIHNNQNMLMERERLASLGQLIGGIAHNLKTPIMSISGAAEGLTDLIKEYDESIGDQEVTFDDHHAIAKDMYDWVSKIKSYTEYMSDVITAVKGQAVSLSENEATSFDIDELVKRVNILMKHELKHSLTSLNININVDKSTTLHGDITSLVQVINNMISNSIQSYNGEPNKDIDLIIDKKDNNIVISIKDYGPGLPKVVKDKLFKEMITTKGKNGTGLGLFMSYSTIRAHFNGNITFETEEGKGTTFNIILPLL